MTRIEALMQVTVQLFCPNERQFNFVVLNGPTVDYQTAVKNKADEIIGCRGITCEQCWKMEVGLKYGGK